MNSVPDSFVDIIQRGIDDINDNGNFDGELNFSGNNVGHNKSGNHNQQTICDSFGQRTMRIFKKFHYLFSIAKAELADKAVTVL